MCVKFVSCFVRDKFVMGDCARADFPVFRFCDALGVLVPLLYRTRDVFTYGLRRGPEVVSSRVLTGHELALDASYPFVPRGLWSKLAGRLQNSTRSLWFW